MDKYQETFAKATLFLLVFCLISEVLHWMPGRGDGHIPLKAQAAGITETGEDPAVQNDENAADPTENSSKREKVAMVIKGRLAYRLYDDGTATVVDETRAVSDFLSNASDVTVPARVFYGGDMYTVTAIGQYAFYCKSYKRIVLPDTVRTIERVAFYKTECDELVLPDTITSIGEYAFCGMSYERDFRYPSGVAEVLEGALWNCGSRTGGTLTIPDTVTALRYHAVGSLNTQVVLSGSLTELAPFSLVVDYDRLELAGTGGNLLENGMLFNADRTELLVALKIMDLDTYIPKTVRRIHPYAFAHVDLGEFEGDGMADAWPNAYPIRVFVPEGVRELADGTFYKCTWLDCLTLPSTLELIGEGAVSGGYLPLLVIHSGTVPEIVGKDNGALEVDVPDSSVEAYRSGLEGRFTYGTLH